MTLVLLSFLQQSCSYTIKEKDPTHFEIFFLKQDVKYDFTTSIEMKIMQYIQKCLDIMFLLNLFASPLCTGILKIFSY